MTTVKDVARAAGVSVATVSRVINNDPKVKEKTRLKLQKVMKEMGYRINENARALVTRKNTTIGTIIPDLTDPFFALLASAVDKVARKNKMQQLLSTGEQTAASELQAIHLLMDRRCDVIVAHSKLLPSETLISLAKQIPGLVIIDRYIEEISERCIWLDNMEGGAIAGRHLLALNHTEFAVIASNYQIEDPQLRLDGFANEVIKAGYPINPELVEKAEPNQQGGESAVQKLLSKGIKFTALFVYNDAMAIGAISTLEDNGYKVPQDVSVIGFDDVLLSKYSRPKLTTLHYPIEKMATEAANLAIELSRNNSPVHNKTQQQKTHKYVPLLVKRESTITKLTP